LNQLKEYKEKYEIAMKISIQRSMKLHHRDFKH